LKDETKSILGIACLYVSITAMFSLLEKLVSVFSSGKPQEGLKNFMNGSILWLVVALITVYVLYSLNAREKQGYAAMLNNPVIRKTSGVLIAITGLFSLMDAFPLLVKSIVFFRSLGTMMENTDALISTIAAEAVSLLIIICQVLFGIYLLKYKNKSSGINA